MTLPKSLIIMSFAFLSSFSLHAQDCKFDIDKKDDFTGEHVRSIRHKIGAVYYNWVMLLEQKGPKYYMTVIHEENGKINDIITKGSKIFFKLEDGTVIDMELTDDAVPIHSIPSDKIVTTWMEKGELSKETMMKISKAGISVIRLKIGSKDIDSPTATGKSANKIREYAECMLKD